MNVGSHLAKRALLQPELEGLVDLHAGRRLTFAELNSEADRAAHACADKGLGKGDRLALLLSNGHEFVTAFYGAARSGLVIVPLNWRLVAQELAFMLRDSGATVLVYDADYDAVVGELRELGGGESGTPVQHWIRAGQDAPPSWADDYATLLAGASSEPVAVDVDGADPLFIMYTSGTTGLPKGALHTHDSVEWGVLTACATADIRNRDRYLISLPLFHVGALNPLVDSVYLGATAVLMRQFDPRAVWDVIRDERITSTLAVPAMLLMMQQTYDPSAHSALALRWIMSGAAPVPVSLIEAYVEMGFEIHQVYGLTESCGPGCLISPDQATERIGSTGKAFFHTDVRIVDKQGNDVPAGEPGEVLLRGRHIMAEYWNRPDATAETIKDGWLYTGDVAIQDEEGFVYIQDRIKDMIISGGENIYPAEIENVLVAHPQIADAAVIGIPSSKWGESPLAVVVRSDGALDEATVLDHCAGRLARFKQPRRAVFVDAIPRNPTGKVLKRLLREQFEVEAPE